MFPCCSTCIYKCIIGYREIFSGYLILIPPLLLSVNYTKFYHRGLIIHTLLHSDACNCSEWAGVKIQGQTGTKENKTWTKGNNCMNYCKCVL